jgi:hypothetical protein
MTPFLLLMNLIFSSILGCTSLLPDMRCKGLGEILVLFLIVSEELYIILHLFEHLGLHLLYLRSYISGVQHVANFTKINDQVLSLFNCVICFCTLHHYKQKTKHNRNEEKIINLHWCSSMLVLLLYMKVGLCE